MRSFVMMAFCALWTCAACAVEQAPSLEPGEIIGLEEQLRGLGLAPGQPMHLKSAPEGTQGPLLIGYAPNQSPGGAYPAFIIEVDAAPALGRFAQSRECRVGIVGKFMLRENGKIFTGLDVAMSEECAQKNPSEDDANESVAILAQVFVKCVRFASQNIRDRKNGVKAL